jgi:hypothetical protein
VVFVFSITGGKTGAVELEDLILTLGVDFSGASFGEKGTFLHGGYYTLFYLLLTSPTSLVILKTKLKTRGAR